MASHATTPGRRVWATIAIVSLLCSIVAGAGSAASRVATPPVSFTGTYVVTFRVTNTTGFKPTTWIYGVVSACTRPCKSVSFHQRLASETSWRSFVLTYNWSGSAYEITPRVQKGMSDCRGTKGAAVKRGYDVVSTQTFRPTRVVNGRAVAFSGRGLDAYKVNDRGRRGGCTAGAYTFALSGKSQ
ncbi:MAG: hypothetical protein H0X39_17070 [Actinobacteria bacterium]|nr:hypothetical protein [Actinomycetota bacterium]